MIVCYFLEPKFSKRKFFLPCKNFLAAVFLSATAWSSCTTLPGSCLRLLRYALHSGSACDFLFEGSTFQTNQLCFSNVSFVLLRSGITLLHGKHFDDSGSCLMMIFTPQVVGWWGCQLFLGASRPTHATQKPTTQGGSLLLEIPSF